MADEVLFTPGGPQPGSPVESPLRKEAQSRVMFRPQERQDAVSFGQSLATSFALDSPIAAMSRQLEVAGLKPDENFVLDAKLQNELMADVPEVLHLDLADALTNATSREHADIIKRQFVTELEREELLASAGMGGLATRLLANVADPVNLALAWGTGGLGHLTKAGALRGALRVGAWTAAENAAIETAIVAGSHTRGVGDVVFSALGGFAMGGAAGGLLSRLDSATADAVNTTMTRQMDAEARATLDLSGLDSAGAARVRGYTRPLMEDDVAREFDISTSPDVPKSALGKARFDVVGRLGQDEDPFVRDLGRKLAQEGVGLEGNGVLGGAASESAAITHKTLMSGFRRVAEPSYSDWRKEMGKSNLTYFSLNDRSDFYNQVGRAVASGGETTDSPAVLKAARATSQAFTKYLRQAKAAGLKGFDDIPENPRYMPHVHNQAAVREFVARYGSDELENLVAAGMRRSAGEVELDAATTKQIAKAYVNRIRRVSQGMDTGMAHGIRVDDVDMLKEMLRDTDLDEDAIEAVLASTKKSVDKQGKLRQAKRRLQLDETASIRVAAKDNIDDVRTVSVADIFEMDAEKALFAYSRSLSGWIGLANNANIKSQGDAQKVVNLVRSRGEKFGKDRKAIDANAERIEFLIKGITGSSLEADPSSAFSTAARTVRDVNFLRIGAGFGMAQLAELGNIFATSGVRNMLSQMPALRGMMKRGVDGKLSNKLAADLEDMIAPGTDRLLNQASTRWEEHGFTGFGGERSIGRAVDDSLQVAKRITADIGGLNPFTVVFQRAAAAGIAQKLAGFAFGAPMSKGQVKRLKTMGIDPDGPVWASIKRQMKKHATARDSFVPGRKTLKAINPEKWDDADALDTFTLAMHREARRTVQENDIGGTAIWMESSWGKLLTQFRSFALNAWTKATLHNIHHRDIQSFNSLIYGMFFAGSAYIAQTSLNVSDKKRRKEMLEPEEIAKAAFQRTGVSSLVPGMIDSTLTVFARQDPLFAHGRSSGLATGFIRGNPSVDAINKAAQVVGMPAAALDPNQEITQRDYRAAVAMLPIIGGMTGVKRVLNALGEDLPE